MLVAEHTPIMIAVRELRYVPVVVDIVSFLLKSNNMPPGTSELPPDLDALKTVVMEYRP